MRVIKLFKTMLIMLIVIMSINIFLAGSLDKIELGFKILLSFILIFAAGIVEDKKAYILFMLILAYFLLGVLNKNWVNYIVVDYCNIIVILFSTKFVRNINIYEQLLNVFSRMAPIVFIASMSYLYINGWNVALNEGERMVFATAGFNFDSVKMFLRLLQYSVFLLPIYTYEKLSGIIKIKNEYWILSCVVLYFIVNIGAVNRAATFVAFISLVSYSHYRFKFTARLLLAFSLVGVAYVFSESTITELVIDRFTTNDLESTRNREARDYIMAASPMELILGKGLGGANALTYAKGHARGILMLHYGHMTIIMKGGVILFFCWVIYLQRKIRLLWREHLLLVTPVILMILLEIGHTQWMYWLSNVLVIMSLVRIRLCLN